MDKEIHFYQTNLHEILIGISHYSYQDLEFMKLIVKGLWFPDAVLSLLQGSLTSFPLPFLVPPCQNPSQPVPSQLSTARLWIKFSAISSLSFLCRYPSPLRFFFYLEISLSFFLFLLPFLLFSLLSLFFPSPSHYSKFGVIFPRFLVSLLFLITWNNNIRQYRFL